MAFERISTWYYTGMTNEEADLFLLSDSLGLDYEGILEEIGYLPGVEETMHYHGISVLIENAHDTEQLHAKISDIQKRYLTKAARKKKRLSGA